MSATELPPTVPAESRTRERGGRPARRARPRAGKLIRRRLRKYARCSASASAGAIS